MIVKIDTIIIIQCNPYQAYSCVFPVREVQGTEVKAGQVVLVALKSEIDISVSFDNVVQ